MSLPPDRPAGYIQDHARARRAAARHRARRRVQRGDARLDGLQECRGLDAARAGPRRAS